MGRLLLPHLSSVHCSHVLNFSHYLIAVRALVDFTQEHPDAGGATVTVAGQASWNKYVRKLDTTLDEWALGSKLGDRERPSFGVTGTNVSRYSCLHI